MSSLSIAVFRMGYRQGICSVILLLGAHFVHMPNIFREAGICNAGRTMKCLRTMPALPMQLTDVVMHLIENHFEYHGTRNSKTALKAILHDHKFSMNCDGRTLIIKCGSVNWFKAKWVNLRYSVILEMHTSLEGPYEPGSYKSRHRNFRRHSGIHGNKSTDTNNYSST